MGDAKAKKRSYGDLLTKCPFCIYCGGNVPATTVDHMPPAICFRWKHRPKGLEFSSCAICNNGASRADYVAGLVSRFYEPNEETDYVGELAEMFKSLSTNVPGLLEEMKMGRGAEKIAMKRLPAGFQGRGVKVGGPIMSKHMQVFSLKMGLAMHFSATQRPLNENGIITVRWYTNYEKFTGDFPDEIMSIFQEPVTLVNGKKHVSDQFQYSCQVSEDGNFGVYFASFRSSFSVFALVSQDKDLLDQNAGNTFPMYHPSDVKNLIVALKG
jgi:hypothetical protein